MKKENSIYDIPKDCYGYCPICNGRGIIRERRIDGNDKCINGHTYKSRDSILELNNKPLKS